jgi:hypothetical protein
MTMHRTRVNLPKGCSRSDEVWSWCLLKLERKWLCTRTWDDSMRPFTLGV